MAKKFPVNFSYSCHIIPICFRINSIEDLHELDLGVSNLVNNLNLAKCRFNPWWEWTGGFANGSSNLAIFHFLQKQADGENRLESG